MPYNEMEQEVIILDTILEMIDDMVNYQMFEKSERTDNITLLPRSSTHAKFFNVLLVDFLSRPYKRNGRMPFNLPEPPNEAIATDKTYLFYLRRIACSPKLGSDANSIIDPVKVFSDWLETNVSLKRVWFSSADMETDVEVKRIEFLRICGNIAKHNISRLESDVSRICNIINRTRENRYHITDSIGFSIAEEFYELFHTDIFHYHLSTLAELLNNIRCGIFSYLNCEFELSFERVYPYPMYRYRVPPDIIGDLAQSKYRNLMDRAREEPFFPQFTVTEWLKKRY